MHHILVPMLSLWLNLFSAAKPEAAKSQPPKPEPVHPEPPKPEPPKPRAAQPEPPKAEPTKPEPAPPKPKPAEPVPPKPAEPAPKKEAMPAPESGKEFDASKTSPVFAGSDESSAKIHDENQKKDQMSKFDASLSHPASLGYDLPSNNQ